MKGKAQTQTRTRACEEQALLQPRNKTWLDATGPLRPCNFCFLQLQAKKGWALSHGSGLRTGHHRAPVSQWVQLSAGCWSCTVLAALLTWP